MLTIDSCSRILFVCALTLTFDTMSLKIPLTSLIACENNKIQMDKLIKMSSWSSQEPKATIINLKSFKPEDKSEWWMINEKFLNLNWKQQNIPMMPFGDWKSKSFHLSVISNLCLFSLVQMIVLGNTKSQKYLLCNTIDEQSYS